MRILLVEDDQQFGHSIHRAIKSEGYASDWVQTCEDATIAINDGHFDVIILDWELPDNQGTQWLEQKRAQGMDIPTLMMTARRSSADKVIGLDKGADDYVTKPFDLDEFFARIRALLRRGTVKSSRIIKTKHMEINPDTSVVQINETDILLSKAELDLLVILANRSGEFVSKRHLENALYDWDSAVTPNAIEVQISRLRKKVGANLIKTQRNFGYKLEK
ncbi:MAG: DNA-binding response regulator [Robiginitomaculum sp.]|nr:MAG: DNA-binding response regulator [Robiginitomaculum sp.]